MRHTVGVLPRRAATSATASFSRRFEGRASGRTLSLVANKVTATGHHVRGVDVWFWNVQGLDTLDVASSTVALTQTKNTDQTEDGSDATATAYGVHVAFNDRFSDVYIGTFKRRSN